MKRFVIFQLVIKVVLLSITSYSFAQSGGTLSPASTLSSTEDKGYSSPQIEEVVVTGTRLTKRDFESPSPVYTLSADAIQLQGFPTMEELLSTLPQFSPSNGRAAGVGDIEGGVQEASVNLRGLGANRNLVLLDGGRLGASGTAGVINVNTLPSIMIERVEVLTGGASSVYGSDAMSGVVNFITRRDFEGFELNGNYETSDRSDAGAWSVSAAGGFNFAEDRGNVSGFIDYYERELVFADARDFASIQLYDDATAADWGWLEGEPQGVFYPAGNFYTPNGVTFINGPPIELGDATDVTDIIFDEAGNPRAMQAPEDTFNRFPYLIMQSGLERISGRLRLDYVFSEHLQGHADLLASHHEDNVPAPPTADWARIRVNLDNPVLSPATRQLFADNFEYFNDGLAHLLFLRRYNELGEHAHTHDWESDNWRLNLGLGGDFFDDWRWELNYFQSETNYDYAFRGGVYRSRLQQALLVDPATGNCFDPSNGCVPADVFGPGRLSAEAVGFLSAPPATAKSEIAMQQLVLFTEGQIGTGLDEAATLGLGVDLRREEGEYRPSAALASIDLIGFEPVDVVDGDYNMAEAFAEVFLPLLRDRRFASELSLEAGLRYSDHSEIGGYRTWKTGLGWAPVQSLRLRAMFQHAVRAPNLKEMFQLTQEATHIAGPAPTQVHDPCSAVHDPIGNGHTDLCAAQGIPEELVGTWKANPLYIRKDIWGGNTDLEPERADTWTGGFVWQPGAVPNLSLAVDWYRIEIEDAIQWMDAGLAIDTCFVSGSPGSDVCGAFDRAEDGNIEWQFHTYRNLSTLTAEGVDLQLEFAREMPGGLPGFLRINFIGNWNIETSGQAHKLSPEYHCEGYFGSPCNLNSMGTFPEFRSLTTLGYTLEKFTTELRWQWIDGTDNTWKAYPPNWLQPEWPLAADRLDSVNYFDLNLSWQATDSFSVTAGIINMTDKDPPLYGSQARGLNTDPAMYDILGRRYHASISWRF